MNRKLVILLTALLSVAARAQTATPADSKPPVVVEAPADKTTTPHCLRETGTRIVHKGKQACLGLAGRSYDQDDLRSTGATDIGDALQQLDPAISIHH